MKDAVQMLLLLLVVAAIGLVLFGTVWGVAVESSGGSRTHPWIFAALGAALAVTFGGLAHAMETRNRPFARRWHVLTACFALAFVVSSASAVLAGGHPLLFVAPLAGPFAEPCAWTDYSWARMSVHGGALLLALAAHPAWPRWYTAAVSVAAAAWWLLVGLAFTYAGV